MLTGQLTAGIQQRHPTHPSLAQHATGRIGTHQREPPRPSTVNGPISAKEIQHRNGTQPASLSPDRVTTTSGRQTRDY
ncbi:hypothetical protein [Actinocrispum wychmicini]|uniref:hypothetical protein n=1 Tax=Actinocrispum wychmicini TaxID=1213861 RepID=UPI00104C734B|nr:hypothetical protein [Actinocrispum wychmicini]